jgi:hypothetical protein
MTKIDPSYGPMMVFDVFFNSPDIPSEQIGGWLVRGHDKDDVYQEYVVVGDWLNAHGPVGWIDWIRTPVQKGSPLLIDD